MRKISTNSTRPNNTPIPTFPLLGERSKKGFTLVELIIVITILAILATIAFISFKGYTLNARDSNRLATLNNIEKWLTLFEIKSGNYPKPDWEVLSWSINWVALVYVWNIWENISRIINISKTPKDPVSETNYIYGTSVDYKYYQLSTVLENGVSLTHPNLPLRIREGIVPITYADSSYKAKVNWNYNWLLKYNWYLYNLPSLIFTWSWNLISTWTYFIVDKKENLPYKLDTNKIQENKNTSTLLQELTWTSSVTLTWVNISAITDKTTFLSNSWVLKEALWYDVSIIWKEIFWEKYFSEVNLSVSNISYSNCLATTYSWITISALNHSISQAYSTWITNWTWDVTATCNNWIVSYGSINTNCNTDYVSSWVWNCILDTCSWTMPTYAQINWTQWTATWSHSTTSWVCKFVCQAWYYWNWTDCVAASAGYYVASSWQISQTSCTTWQYQDQTWQTTFKSCTNKPTNSSYTSSTALTSNSCPWSCDSWFYESAWSCLAYVNWACSSLPTWALYYNSTISYSLVNAPNWTSLVATTAWYSATPTSNTCQYKCDTANWYSRNGSGCSIPRWEQLYTTPWSYTWTVPAWVTSVSVVCVWGGGWWVDAGWWWGGWLVYKNNFTTTSWQNISIIIWSWGSPWNNWLNSSFNSIIIAWWGWAWVIWWWWGWAWWAFSWWDGWWNWWSAACAWWGWAWWYTSNWSNWISASWNAAWWGGWVWVYWWSNWWWGGWINLWWNWWSNWNNGSINPSSVIWWNWWSNWWWGGRWDWWNNWWYGWNWACRIIRPWTTRQFPSTDVWAS